MPIITTTPQLAAYIARCHPDLQYSHIEQITEGSTNFVWRVTSAGKTDVNTSSTSIRGSNGRSLPSSMIVKHAEPYLAAQPEFPFAVERLDFEVRALTEIPHMLAAAAGGLTDGGIDEGVHLPRVLAFDEANHVLFLEDVGKASLAQLYVGLAKLSRQRLGVQLGKWLARLHMRTTGSTVRRAFENLTARRMYRWSFDNLASVLTQHSLDGELGRRINDRYGALIMTDDEWVCHGDLWPGNLVFRDCSAPPLHREPVLKEPSEGGIPAADKTAADSGRDFVVIDWEVARTGSGMTDVGHFAGEAWLLDTLRGSCGRSGSLLDSFLRAYTRSRQTNCLGKQDRWRVAAQFATHVTHWPTIYEWITEDETAQCVLFGALCLGRVDELDEGWFKSSILAPLLGE